MMLNQKYKLIIPTVLLIIILDQLSKFFIKKNVGLNQSLPIIDSILHFTYVTNTGSAFGLLKGFNLFFILLSVIVITAIFYYIKKIKNNERLLQFSAGLLLGGTIGNLIDRILYGFVIDFVDFRVWPVFNIADIAISISITLIIILLWKE